MVERKLALIEEFQYLSNAFDDTLHLEKEVVVFRPSSESWSIIEQIVHCVDFDIANFHRYRWGIVSPGTTVLSFDGSWTSLLEIGISSCLIKHSHKYLYLPHMVVKTDWKAAIRRSHGGSKSRRAVSVGKPCTP